MNEIKDIEAALTTFEEASAKHAEATELGDYKASNKHYNQLAEAATFLKSKNAIDYLLQFLSNSSVGVRMWAACYLLPVYEQEGIKVLEEIAESSGIHSFTAETTLSEWREGNLRF